MLIPNGYVNVRYEHKQMQENETEQAILNYHYRKYTKRTILNVIRKSA